jgi:hypothetical protein
MYTFSGKMLVEVKTVTDSSGGLHITTNLRTRAVGVGNSTGARYVTNEGGMTAENYLSVGTAVAFTAEFSGNVIAVDKGVQDLHYRLLLHISIDPSGNVTSYVDRFLVNC